MFNSNPNANKLSLFCLILVMPFILSIDLAHAVLPEVDKKGGYMGGHNFGESVAVSGDYAIVGAERDIQYGEDAGAAYIFYYDGTSWNYQAKLTASDHAAFAEFGGSVSISGDYAIVGASVNAGTAYIFVRSGTTWTEQAKLTASDRGVGDYFGHSVSIDGDYAIVGAYGNVDSVLYGSAYIFIRNGTTWTEQAKLKAADAFSFDFGYSVSINGDYAIVGASDGSARVFVRSGTSWSQQEKLGASDGASVGGFGYSVSINGDYAVIGAHLDDDNGTGSGSVYVFHRSGIVWTEQDKLLPADGDAGDEFGGSVSIYGDHVIVSSHLDDDNGIDSGSVYMFERDGSNWAEQAKLLAPDGDAGDEFGISVSFDGSRALVGANLDDDNWTDSGSAYIFSKIICPSADLTDDCFVDIDDFAELAGQWLQGPQ